MPALVIAMLPEVVVEIDKLPEVLVIEDAPPPLIVKAPVVLPKARVEPMLEPMVTPEV